MLPYYPFALSLINEVAAYSQGPEWEELRSMCASTVYLLSSTVAEVEPLLWSVLLRLLLILEYDPACATIARCLAHLAAKDSPPATSTYSTWCLTGVVLWALPNGVDAGWTVLNLERREKFQILGNFRVGSGQDGICWKTIWPTLSRPLTFIVKLASAIFN